MRLALSRSGPAVGPGEEEQQPLDEAAVGSDAGADAGTANLVSPAVSAGEPWASAPDVRSVFDERSPPSDDRSGLLPRVEALGTATVARLGTLFAAAPELAIRELEALGLGGLSGVSATVLGRELAERTAQLAGDRGGEVSAAVQFALGSQAVAASTLEAALASQNPAARAQALELLNAAPGFTPHLTESDLPAALAALGAHMARQEISEHSSAQQDLREATRVATAVEQARLRSLAEVLRVNESDLLALAGPIREELAGLGATLSTDAFPWLRIRELARFRAKFQGALPAPLDAALEQRFTTEHETYAAALGQRADAVLLKGGAESQTEAEVADWLARLAANPGSAVSVENAISVLEAGGRLEHVVTKLASVLPHEARPPTVESALSCVLDEAKGRWGAVLGELGLAEAYAERIGELLAAMQRAGVPVETLRQASEIGVASPEGLRARFDWLANEYAKVQPDAAEGSAPARRLPLERLGRLFERIAHRSEPSTRWTPNGAKQLFAEISQAAAPATADLIGRRLGDLAGAEVEPIFARLLKGPLSYEQNRLLPELQNLTRDRADDGKFFAILGRLLRARLPFTLGSEQAPELWSGLAALSLARLDGHGFLKEAEQSALSELLAEHRRVAAKQYGLARALIDLGSGNSNRMRALYDIWNSSEFDATGRRIERTPFNTAVFNSVLDECLLTGRIQPLQVPELEQLAAQGPSSLSTVTRSLFSMLREA